MFFLQLSRNVANGLMTFCNVDDESPSQRGEFEQLIGIWFQIFTGQRQ